MIYGPLVYEESFQVKKKISTETHTKKRKDPLWLSYDKQEVFDLAVGDFPSDHVCKNITEMMGFIYIL